MSENIEISYPGHEGFIKFEQGQANLPEAGPTETRLGRKLRNLKISVTENLIEGYNWNIEDHAGTGAVLTVAFGYSTAPTFQAALAMAVQAMLALGANDEDGPRAGDMPRRELCPDAYMSGPTQ